MSESRGERLARESGADLNRGRISDESIKQMAAAILSMNESPEKDALKVVFEVLAGQTVSDAEVEHDL